MNIIDSLATKILQLGDQLLDETNQANVDAVLALWSGREELFTELKMLVQPGEQRIPENLVQQLQLQNDALLKDMLGLKAAQGDRILALAQNGRAAGSYATTKQYH